MSFACVECRFVPLVAVAVQPGSPLFIASTQRTFQPSPLSFSEMVSQNFAMEKMMPIRGLGAIQNLTGFGWGRIETINCAKIESQRALMSKAELVTIIQKYLEKDTVAAQAERILAAVLNGIKTGVKTKTVQLIGIGTFKVATRKARMGVNPKTGAKIKIKAGKTVKFVAGKAFKGIL